MLFALRFGNKTFTQTWQTADDWRPETAPLPSCQSVKPPNQPNYKARLYFPSVGFINHPAYAYSSQL